MKNRIRLTESDLHRIVKESVKRIIKEHGRGNDWDKRKEWNNFQDPLIAKKDARNNYKEYKDKCEELIRNCNKILNSQFFHLMDRYGVEPILSLQIVDVKGKVSKQINSNKLNELIAFCKENANLPEIFGIYGFLYIDDKISHDDWVNLNHREIAAKYGIPVVIVEILLEFDLGINIEDYDYYEPEIDAIIRRYMNKKRLN